MAKYAVDAMDKYRNNSDLSTYVSFNNGGYLEFRGYKSYIDPRATPFLKSINHKENIYHEYHEFEKGKIPVDDFIKKYNFDYLFLSINDRLYSSDEIDNYTLIFHQDFLEYKVYVRNDIIEKNKKN